MRERHRSRRTSACPTTRRKTMRAFAREGKKATCSLGGAGASRRGQRGGERQRKILALVVGEEAREHEPVAVRGERQLRRAADARLERYSHPIGIEAPRGRLSRWLDAGDGQ